MMETNQLSAIGRAGSGSARVGKEFRVLLIVSLLHLPLGVLIYSAGSFAILHPYSVVIAGFYLAANTRYRLEWVAFPMAYIVGAEVLWRMAGVPVFWEFGKLATSIIAIVALVRRGKFRVPKLPAIYLMLLIPSCLLLISQQSLSASRPVLSFQMSGPFAFVVACWFFSHLKVNGARLRQIMLTAIVPLLSVGFAALFFTVTVEDIAFTGESNFATSGGFGPNQVSGLLGFGAFLALTLLIIFKNSTARSLYLLVAALFLSAQSVMTFSRGGIYNAVGAVIVVLFVMLRSGSAALKRVVPIAAGALIFLLILFPFMDDVTGGALSERFEDTGTSARTQIAASDLDLFLENPVFGVGLGASYSLRASILGHKAMSHTEFSRLFSEHGVFGLGALVVLGYMLLSNYRRQRSIQARAFVAGAAVWSCLFMTNTAMRLAAPSFLLGMTFLTIAMNQTRFRARFRERIASLPGRKI